MSGRISAATERALISVRHHDVSISQAAREQGIAVSTLRRALRRTGAEPQKPGRRPVQRTPNDSEH